MKNILIILILALFYNSKAIAQNDLYLIFDINTPPVTKDIAKYMRLREGLTQINTLELDKISTYHYYFGYPLLRGGNLVFDKKEGTTPQVLPISALSSYPQAKTITELDAEMQPLIELDYTDPGDGLMYSEYLRTYQYFVAIDNFYVIELDHDNNQIIVVECELWWY